MGRRAGALLRQRGYRTYLAAHLIGSFGDSILYLAAGIWVQKLTGSSSGAALTFLFALLPALVAPLAGAVVDRVPRRTALVVLNVVGGVVVLPLLLVSEAGQVWLVYLVMFLGGLVSMGIQPAQSAQLTELADPDDLPAVNGLLRSCLAAFKLVSPAVGAGLFVVAGPQVVVLVDSVTSFVAALLLARLPWRAAPGRPEGTGSFRATFLDGFRALFADPPLRRLTVVGCVFMAVAGTSE
jgi:MFS family permease